MAQRQRERAVAAHRMAEDTEALYVDGQLRAQQGP